jgi:hypothetical protein
MSTVVITILSPITIFSFRRLDSTNITHPFIHEKKPACGRAESLQT